MYGRSKVRAEQLVLQDNPSALVVRTSAFFGPWDRYNFLVWVMDSLIKEQEVPIANDVIVSPTYVPDLVHVSLDFLIDDEKGIWHLTNDGAITWSDLAYKVARIANLPNKYIDAMPVKALNLPATRPHFSVLKSNRGLGLPSLENALHRFFSERKAIVTL
jgi:dTDP-4-dehydrorhamnose reductase